MALIKCPECGAQVSDRAAACIHCGFPLSPQSSAPVQPTIQLYDVVFTGSKGTHLEQKYRGFISQIKDISQMSGSHANTDVIAAGLTKERAEKLSDYVKAIGGQVAVVSSNRASENLDVNKFMNEYFDPNAIRCPYCNSSNVTAGQRGFKMTTGFLGSSKTVLRCAKCGNTWKPR